MMIKLYLILALALHMSVNCLSAYNSNNDTTFAGKVVALDSVNPRINEIAGQTINYFGVFHLKVVVLDLKSMTETDTLLLAIFYNKLSEGQAYLNRFNLLKGRIYIFKIAKLSLCSCLNAFPKLEGKCIGDYYYPASSPLVSKYKVVDRVLYLTEFNK